MGKILLVCRTMLIYCTRILISCSTVTEACILSLSADVNSAGDNSISVWIADAHLNSVAKNHIKNTEIVVHYLYMCGIIGQLAK